MKEPASVPGLMADDIPFDGTRVEPGIRRTRDRGVVVPPVDAPPMEGPQRTVTLTPATAIGVRPVRWFWDRRLALGTLGLVAGREGVGKSTVVYGIVANLTRGQLPGACTGHPRTAIIVATEDSWERTIVPRLMAAGADLSRVYKADARTSEGVESTLLFPRDLVALEQSIRDVNAALIVLDPLMSRLDASLDSHKDQEVRQALEPLVKLADDCDACVVGVIHVSKTASTDPLTMVMGSRAFTAVSRSVLFCMQDPHDEQRRLLGQPKNNLGSLELPTLAYRIVGAKVADTTEGEVWSSKVDWLGEDGRSIKEAVEEAQESSGAKTAAQEAGDWLRDYLSAQDGPVDSQAIKSAARVAGHSVAAVHRARQRLHVRAESRGYPRRTFWSLPAQSSHQSSHTPGESSTNGMNETTTANRGVQLFQSSQSLQSMDSPPEVKRLEADCADF